MSTQVSSIVAAATFGELSIAVSDAYFMVEPAAAVIVSANSHLQTATGGAHDVTRVTGADYRDACAALLRDHPEGLPQGSAWITGGVDSEFTLTARKRRVIQAITIRYMNGQRIRTTPDIVYHAARSAFGRADEAGVDSVVTYLWAIREQYATARLTEMAGALFQAAVDHSAESVNLRRIIVCEPGSDPRRHELAVECLVQRQDLWRAHPHAWSGCRFERGTRPRA